MHLLASLTAVIILSMIHLFVGRCRVFNVLPRSAWLSASAGAAVAYVFVYILPKLAKLQIILGSTSEGGIGAFLEHHAYLVALARICRLRWNRPGGAPPRYGYPVFSV